MSVRQTSDEQPRGITISDIDIPFGRLVMILVKIAIASIPAAIIVWIIIAVALLILTAIFGQGFMNMGMRI